MTGFDRAQRVWDNATPEDHWVFDDEHDDGPDPDDARDRLLDAAMASDWDDDMPSGLADGDWGGTDPLD